VKSEVGQHVIGLLQTAPEGESFHNQTLDGIPYSEVIEIGAFVSTEAVQTHLQKLLEDPDRDVRIATERALAQAKNPESISQFVDEWLHPYRRAIAIMSGSIGLRPGAVTRRSAGTGGTSKTHTWPKGLLYPTAFLIYLPSRLTSLFVTILVEDAVEYALTVQEAPPGNEIWGAVAVLGKRFEPDVNGLFECYLKICESPSVIANWTPEWSVS
jgi:hypothetical protein